MKYLTTILRLALKGALLFLAVVATYALLAGPDQVRTDIDREAFTGCTLLITLVAWRVLLWILFGRSKPKEEASVVAA